MTITSGTILRVVATILWTDGNVMQNVFNAVISGGSDPYDEADVIAEALVWVQDIYANLTSLASDLSDGSEVTVYEFNSGNQEWDEIGSTAWSWNPSGSGEPLPRGCAAIIAGKSTNANVTGRKYVGGLTESSNDGSGLVGAATLTALAAWAVDWVTAFAGGTTGATWTPGVWSPTIGTFYGFAGTALLNSIYAYQRRRKRGVGI